MKETIKYLAWIVVAGVLLVIASMVKDVFRGESEAPGMMVVPADSGFAPVIKKEFRPRSTPFEKHPPIPVKRYPAGVKEKDVKRVITIGKTIPISGIPHQDTTRIIEMKSGEIFIEKPDSGQLVVEEFEYLDPILSWGARASLGITFSRFSHKFELSPSLSLSFLQVLGRIAVPLATVDLTSIGLGVGYQWESFVFGFGLHWRFEDLRKQVKISLQYSIN